MNSRLDSVLSLEAEFAEAMQRLYTVGNGLDRLRQEIEREQAPSPAPPAAPAAPPRRPMPAAAPPPQPAATIKPAPGIPSKQSQPAVSWWQREGMVARVLGVAGAGVTLIGLVMLLVIAIQRGLFGPVPRVVAGAVLAASLIAVAPLVHRRQEENSGALALAATGYAAAYLDVVAMTSIYHYLPVWAGLTLAGLTAASGLLIARAWDSELLGVLTVLGVAVLAPVVGGVLAWPTAAFLVVLAGATFPAQLGRNWPALEVVRIVPAVVILLLDLDLGRVWSISAAPSAPLTVLAVVLAAVGLGSSAWLVSRTPHDVAASAMVGASALPLIALPETFADSRQATVAALATAVAYLLAWHAVCVLQRGTLPLHLRATIAGVAAVAVLQSVVEGAPDDYLGTGVLVVALAYLAMSLVGHSGTAAVVGVAISGVGLLAYARFIPAVLGAEPHGRLGLVTLLDSVLATAVLAALALVLREFDAVPGSGRSVPTSALWLGSLLTSSGAVVSAAVLTGRSIDAEQGGFVAGHAAATLLWMTAAASLLIHGLKRVADAGVSLRAGLVLAAVAVGKLMLFDLAALEGMGRVLAFIGSGTLLLAMGTGYARALDRSRRTRPV